MIRWQSAVLALGVAPGLGQLLFSPEPAMILGGDGGRVLWANPTAGQRLGVSRFAELAARNLPSAVRRTLADLMRSAPEQGTLARLRLTDDPAALPLLCRCRPIRAGGMRALLVLPQDMMGQTPTPAELAGFFTDAEIGAVLVDDGEVVGEGAAGLAAEITPATPAVEVPQNGRTLRLLFVKRRPRASVRRPPASERLLDGPALSAVAAGRHPGQGRSPVAVAEEALPDQPRVRRLEPVPEPQPRGREPAPAAVRTSEPQAAAEPKPQPSAEQPQAKPKPRAVSAGRVSRTLARAPVRFLWQTDASDRLLFLSPGLAQVVGRNAEIVGERWPDASARLRLDPAGLIARALRQRDTWSGLTAWWPVEGSNVRVPVELTALPVFGPDQSFQGYRGFGILRPAEALMPAAFEARFGPPAPLGEPQPPYEESPAANVVPIRADLDRMADSAHLTAQERNAFEEIAEALRDRIVDGLAAKAGAGAEEPASEEGGEDAAADAHDDPHAAVVDAVPDEPSTASPPAAAGQADMPVPDPTPDTTEERQSTRTAAELRLSAVAEELAETRRRLREMAAILDTATDGVVVLDAEGRIESANASAEALFGLDAQEMVGRRFEELLTPETRQAAVDYLSGLRDSGVASLLNEGREIAAAAGTGSIPLFITMGRISADEGKRFCAVLRDITHWKRIEADLTAAKRAAEDASSQKSEFLARVGSEIREPLNRIIAHAEAMIEERLGPVQNERYREHLREIRASGEHVVNLVDDLLDIARIEAGKLVLDFSAVPLNEIVREAIALVQAQANRARVVLRSSLSREVPAIVGDEGTLRQILLNLVSNAVRHAGSGGQVIVSTSLSETGEALLRIRDTGHGMTEEEVARALEPFRDLSIASLADRAATGLGLPLTKALVEANRASLSIKSARGEGTVITVTIPPTRVLSE